MISTSARLLSLLSLLQSQREWSGAELAERTGVDVRTLRRDVDRLRELGYAVSASSGPGGGYRLDRGAVTPPLLFSDDEAIAVALALTETASTLEGSRDAVMGALARMNRLLPPRLSRRLSAVERATTHLTGPRPRTAFRTLASLASAVLDRSVITFGYIDAQANRTRREVEPLRLVHARGHYYLVAMDRHRGALRTFRLDRVEARSLSVTAETFAPPVDDAALDAWVARSVEGRPAAHVAEVAVHGRWEELRATLPHWLGELTPLDESRARLTLRADSLDGLVALVVYTGREVEVLSPPQLREALAAVAARLTNAAARRDAPGTPAPCSRLDSPIEGPWGGAAGASRPAE